MLPHVDFVAQFAAVLFVQLLLVFPAAAYVPDPHALHAPLLNLYPHAQLVHVLLHVDFA